MYIRLIRNEPKGSAITGRLVINGHWFCYTLERVGYQISALCYHVAVTMSPKFKRLLPLVTGVPRTPQSGYGTPEGLLDGAKAPLEYRQGIRIHRGSKPEHSTGCILVVGDGRNDNTDNLRPNRTRSNRSNEVRKEYPLGAQGGNNPSRGRDIDCRGMLSPLSSKNNTPLSSIKTPPVGCRSSADIEQSLTQLLLQAQQAHEEIILEVNDFRPGTELGYNTSCPPELQKQ